MSDPLSVWATGLALSVVTSTGASTPVDAGVRDRVVIEGRRFHPSDDPTTAASVREPPDRATAFADLGTVLRTVPGVQVQRSGAPGSFIGASIRGGTLQQTAVYIGDLPVSGADSGAFDLGVLPPELFESVEVYRGGAPAWLSAGAIGGVVRLMPDAEYVARPSGAGAQVGAGSFDAGYASLSARDADGGVRWVGTGGVIAATNDFPVDDESGTAFDETDDVERRRENADLQQAHGAGYVEVDVGPGRISAVALTIRRDQGEPGSAARPATEARRERTYSFASAGYTLDTFWGPRRVRLQVAAGAALDDDRVNDPAGQIGLSNPDDVSTELWSTQLRAAGTVGLVRGLDATLVATAAWEEIAFEDRLGGRERPPSSRATQAGAFELAATGEVLDRRWDLRGSVRLQATQAEAGDVSNQGDVVQRTDRVDPTVRLAGRLDLVRGLSVVSSFMNGIRLPSTLELFGDRANLRGNPRLEPESGQQLDAGLVACFSLGSQVRVDAEARLFGLWLDDLIVLRRNSQTELIPFNLTRGQVLGLEAGGRVELTRYFEIAGALTAQHTEDDRGRQLAFRAPFVGSLLASARSGALGPLDDVSGRLEVAYRSSIPISPSNLERLPERTTVDVGLEVLTVAEALRAYAEVRDLFDARGSDFLGFPLPGRRFEVGLQVRKTW